MFNDFCDMFVSGVVLAPGAPVTIPPPHLHAMPPHSGPPPAHPGAPVPHVNPAFFPSATSTPSNAAGVVSTFSYIFGF